MWTERLSQTLKMLLAVSLIFAGVSAGIFFLQLASNMKELTATTTQSLQSISKNVSDMRVMVNATLFQVGDVSHETADMVRMEKIYVTQESKQLVLTGQKLNQTLDQLQVTIKNVDQSQQGVSDATKQALLPIPGVLTQTQATLLQLQKTTEETQNTIAIVGQTVEKTKPIMDNLNGTTSHIENITGRLAIVVDEATKPQPWYKKAWGYVWVPIKLTTIFAK